MWPDLPEIVIILIICLSTFGLLKLDEFGEAAWRLRQKLDSSVDNDADDGSSATNDPR